MFVQSAKFIQETKHDLNDIYVYGQEYMGETARLAKMNLMVNNIRGEITETNSYESDPYNGLGKFDFVNCVDMLITMQLLQILVRVSGNPNSGDTSHGCKTQNTHVILFEVQSHFDRISNRYSHT